MAAADRLAQLLGLLDRRVVVLDGAAGTTLGGSNPDALVLTAPRRVADLHAEYLRSGADLITTNTFRATAIAQQPFGLATRVRELNTVAARLAREAVDAYAAHRPGFVAGAVGPIRGARDQVRAAYREQAEALIAGGVDLLLVETVVTAAQAVDAVSAIRAVSGDVPVMVSATIERTGRLPSGERVTAFYDAVRGAAPFSVGLNCGVGAEGMRGALEELAAVARCPVSCHPSAGLPDASGAYPESAAAVASTLRAFADAGLVRIIGGCCGTTAEYVAALAGKSEVGS